MGLRGGLGGVSRGLVDDVAQDPRLRRDPGFGQAPEHLHQLDLRRAARRFSAAGRAERRLPISSSNQGNPALSVLALSMLSRHVKRLCVTKTLYTTQHEVSVLL